MGHSVKIMHPMRGTHSSIWNLSPLLSSRPTPVLKLLVQDALGVSEKSHGGCLSENRHQPVYLLSRSVRPTKLCDASKPWTEDFASLDNLPKVRRPPPFI